MKLPQLAKIKPSMLIALIVVLVGGALFLTLPLIVGPGAGFGSSYKIESSDHISSWTWDGVYKDGAQREADAEKEIERIKGMMGKAGISDYDLYVGIASQYELLGEGKLAYNYLSRAIELEPKRGLAYMNMGHLMEEMGAFATAHKAYEAAVTAEPENQVFQMARQNFLIQHTPTQ